MEMTLKQTSFVHRKNQYQTENHKRVLFVVSRLNCGGINRALDNLLRIWDSDISVSVLAFDSTGQFAQGFHNSTIVKAPKLLDFLIRNLKNQRGFWKLICASVKFFNKITHNYLYIKSMERLQQKISVDGYDAVIAFSEGLPTSFVADVENANKIAWIHCDYKSYQTFCPNNLEEERKIYSKFNHIVCVSDYTRQSFTEVFPELESKTYYIYNILDIDGMRVKAKDFTVDEYNPDYFNIVTVGRIDPVKFQSRIPAIASKLRFTDYNWYIIGPVMWQSEYDKLIKEIKRYGLLDKIHILGMKSNPYPYIMNADLLVNTSVSEACPYVINEAKILGTPVVCCDFGSAKEFISNGKDGYSVSFEDVAEHINKLHDDHSLYATIKENLLHFDYDNEAIIKKITKLL